MSNLRHNDLVAFAGKTGKVLATVNSDAVDVVYECHGCLVITTVPANQVELVRRFNSPNGGF